MTTFGAGDLLARVQTSKPHLERLLQALPSSGVRTTEAWNEGDDFKDSGPSWTEWGESI